MAAKKTKRSGSSPRRKSSSARNARKVSGRKTSRDLADQCTKRSKARTSAPKPPRKTKKRKKISEKTTPQKQPARLKAKKRLSAAERKANPSAAQLATRFKKGQTGNPKGPPKGGINLTNRLRMAISQEVKYKVKGKKHQWRLVADILVDKAIEAAKRGKFSFFKEIFDRIDGKVPDHVILESTKKVIAQETEKAASKLLEIVSDKAEKYLSDDRLASFLVEVAEEVESLFQGVRDETGLVQEAEE